MKILALETSTEYCSVALWRHGDVDARERLAGQRHSELLLDMVDELLQRHGIRPRDLDGIAFGAGPGSFTGLRIACGVTQGLAFGADLPVVGVSALLALAERARAERAICCLDARMGQIYHAAYENNGARWETVHAPGLCAPEEAPPPLRHSWTGCGSGFTTYPEAPTKRLRSENNGARWETVHAPGLCAPEEAPPPLRHSWTGCGSGFTTYREALTKRYGERLSAIMPRVYAHAEAIVGLAVHGFGEGRAVAAEQAVPVYIRDKVALTSDE